MKKIIFILVFVAMGILSLPVFSATLQLYNTHTQESFFGEYKDNLGKYDKEILKKIDYFLRDHRTQTVHKIDVRLLDLLFDLSVLINPKNPETVCFHIISAYRTPKTNKMLQKKTKGVYSQSAHMKGEAIDIRIPGVSLKYLRDSAQSLKRGGVGYYPGPNFIHVDLGKVKSWGPL